MLNITLIIIIYILVFAIFALYEFSQKYKTLNKQQQVVYLMEAEKVFTAFDKIPDIIWEDEFKKYDEVLKKYKEIKMERWISN